MKIRIEGQSQDLSYEELSNKLNDMRKHKTIDIDINGLKFKGKVVHYEYHRTPSNLGRDDWEILGMTVMTIKEQIKDLYIGVKKNDNI